MSYRFSSAVPEWRVLAAHVPWDLAAPIDATNAAITATAHAIIIHKVKEVFANEMGQMHINLNDLLSLDVAEQSFEICHSKMKLLLLLLETLVLEQVLHDPDAREEGPTLLAVRVHIGLLSGDCSGSYFVATLT